MLYLAYPLWLLANQKNPAYAGEQTTNGIDSVSVILLSYNGKRFLEKKINSLMKGLSGFKHYELIIIDDHSNDGSGETLNRFKNEKGITIIGKKARRGIPHSMNMGMKTAKYETIVFCDQRQELSDNILNKLVMPLAFDKIGAVSVCISHRDKGKSVSLLRRHENFIKSLESKTGNLIGVYGPLYAIKKDCYSPIPENIILDDLYLSLRILRTKQITMQEDCLVIDNNFSLLYDYNRTKRYLAGFWQILRDKNLMAGLNAEQKLMLVWHKYVRLLIPFFLFLCYISTGYMATRGIGHIIVFGILTILGIMALFPNVFKTHFRMKNFIRMNVLYIIAFLDIFVNNVVLNRKANFNYDKSTVHE